MSSRCRVDAEGAINRKRKCDLHRPVQLNTPTERLAIAKLPAATSVLQGRRSGGATSAMRRAARDCHLSRKASSTAFSRVWSRCAGAALWRVPDLNCDLRLAGAFRVIGRPFSRPEISRSAASVRSRSLARARGWSDRACWRSGCAPAAGRMSAWCASRAGERCRRLAAGRIERFPGLPSSVTRGTSPVLWHFPLADGLIDTRRLRSRSLPVS
jgi:hypothetical protein